MTLLQRRLLFYFFILLFIAVVPVVLLYATGRTVNWRRFELQKTASIMVESEPAGAYIFLNGQRPSTLLGKLFGRQTPATTPTKLPDLVPGTYSLRLEAPGYFPWEQSIVVRPGEVFSTGLVRLFKDTEPQLVTALDGNSAADISPDGRTVVSTQPTKLSLFSIPENKQSLVSLPAAVGTSIRWSRNQDMFLYGDRYIVSRDGQLLLDLATVTSGSVMPRWDSENNNRLYLLAGTSLSRLDTQSKKIETVGDIAPALGNQAVDDYEPSGRQTYIATAAPSNLLIVNPSAPDRGNLTSLPAGDYSFRRDGQEYVLLEDTQNRSLYRIEQPLPLIQTHRVVRISNDYGFGRWGDGRLIYATPFEIRLWDENNEGLVSRFSEALTGVAFVQDDEYAVFTTGKGIYIIPLSGVRAGNAHLLAETEKLTALAAVSQHDLYVIGSLSGTYGLYRITF